MPRFKHRPLAAAIIATFSATPVALAQTKPEQTLPEVKVQGESFRPETTGSATRTETPLRDIPQFINTIPQGVTLHPRVVFGGDPPPAREAVDALHHRAHEACFIANSVLTDVRCEPVHD